MSNELVSKEQPRSECFLRTTADGYRRYERRSFTPSWRGEAGAVELSTNDHTNPRVKTNELCSHPATFRTYLTLNAQYQVMLRDAAPPFHVLLRARVGIGRTELSIGGGGEVWHEGGTYESP